MTNTTNTTTMSALASQHAARTSVVKQAVYGVPMIVADIVCVVGSDCTTSHSTVATSTHVADPIEAAAGDAPLQAA